MKKLLVVLFGLLVIALLSVYLFIPGKIKIRASIPMKATFSGVTRTLINENNWKRWWPGKIAFQYGQQTFSVKNKILNVYDIDIYAGMDTIVSQLELIPIKNGTTAISWRAEQVTSNSPFTRFSRYKRAKATEGNMYQILQNMKAFLEHTENIYGFEIRQTFVSDSALVSVRRSFEHYPTIYDIDEMIQDLKKYIAQHNATETNAPMLNVFKIDRFHYEAMTAIPVNKALPTTKKYVTKFLLKGGNILEAQITGGPSTIENSLIELENYRTDHKFNSPAIPFQLLVTDRAKETDTTKWITKLYYPIF